MNFRKWLFSVFLLFSLGTLAQGTDLLLLRNAKDRTIKTFLAGSFVQFTDISGHEVTGVLRKLERDTLFITYYDVKQRYTMWGTTMADTLTAYMLRYHYNEIYSVVKDPQSFEFVRDGTLFIIGGVAYAALHSINGLIKKEPLDGKTLAISGGVAATGFLMKKLRKRNYVIGRKYTLQYIGLK